MPKVVAVTANGLYRAQDYIEKGFDNVMEKPTDEVKLEEILKTIEWD